MHRLVREVQRSEESHPCFQNKTGTVMWGWWGEPNLRKAVHYSSFVTAFQHTKTNKQTARDSKMNLFLLQSKSEHQLKSHKT